MKNIYIFIYKVSNFFNSPIDSGIGPLNWLLSKSLLFIQLNKKKKILIW